MFRIKVNLPNCSETISTHSENHLFDNLEQVRTYLNTNYFHGLDIVTRNMLYSLTSRPKTLKHASTAATRSISFGRQHQHGSTSTAENAVQHTVARTVREPWRACAAIYLSVWTNMQYL